MKGLTALLLSLLLPTAQAHKPSDSYLTLTVKAAATSGQWDIALRDLDFALTLDADGNGEITWGEVRARHADIAAYATQRLQVTADDKACTVEVGTQQIDEHTDGRYSVLPLSLQCEVASPTTLALTYTLFADLDPAAPRPAEPECPRRRAQRRARPATADAALRSRRDQPLAAIRRLRA